MHIDIPQVLLDKYRHHWLLEHLLGQRLAGKITRVSPGQLQAQVAQALQGQNTPRVHTIERRKNLSLEEFQRVYLRMGIPVVLQGAARSWGCINKWTPEWLAEQFGDDEVSLIDAAPGDVSEIDYQMKKTSLRDLIQEMQAKPLEKYSRFNRLLYEHPELKKDMDQPWLKKHRNSMASGQTFQVFIGGKTSKTHLHAAAEHNLFTQVYGRKHWYLYPPSYDAVLQPPVNRAPYFHSAYDPDQPDFNKFPAMQYLDHYECILEPGDIFFNPPSWWHHVTNLDNSIGVGYRWFAAGNAFQIDWAQTLLTLLAVNPPIWKAMQYRSDFSKIFSYMSRR